MMLSLCLLLALSQDPTHATCGFEGMSGPLQDSATGVGLWTATRGSASIDGRHAKSGSQCLHMGGGTGARASTVELALKQPAMAGDELSFWAERWTRRSPFRFTLEAQGTGDWRPIHDATEELRVGGFDTRVSVRLQAGDLRLRLLCEAPPGTGILIDDVVLQRAVPMQIISTTVAAASLPILLGDRVNPLLHVVVETAGSLDPLVLSELRFTIEGAAALSGSELYATAGSSTPPTPQSDAERFGAANDGSQTTFGFTASRELLPGKNHFWLCVTVKPGTSIDARLAASCTRVQLADGQRLDLPDPGPQAAARLGIGLRRAGDDDAKVYRIPGLITTTKGALIAVYDARWNGSGDLPGDVDVGMSRSTDGGQNWEPMRIIMDMGNAKRWRYDGVGDPSILVDRTTGRIFVIATWSHGDRSWRGSGPGLKPEETGQLMLVQSDDDGTTWSDPLNLTAMLKRPEWCFLLQGPGRGICMEDGTLVFPAQFQLSPEEQRLPHSTVIASRDNGQTWQIGTGMRGNTTESAVVELQPGQLMLNARDNRGGSRSIYTSGDLGLTWLLHPTSRKDLREPVCMGSLIHVGRELTGSADGRLLFSNPNVARSPRRRMTIKASIDSGDHWQPEASVLLDAGNSAGYSCLTMIDAETVGILYEGSRAQLCFQRIPLAEILSH